MAFVSGHLACDDGPPTEPPEGDAGFQIEIPYVEGTEPTDEQRQAFEDATRRWE